MLVCFVWGKLRACSFEACIVWFWFFAGCSLVKEFLLVTCVVVSWWCIDDFWGVSYLIPLVIFTAILVSSVYCLFVCVCKQGVGGQLAEAEHLGSVNPSQDVHARCNGAHHSRHWASWVLIYLLRCMAVVNLFVPGGLESSSWFYSSLCKVKFYMKSRASQIALGPKTETERLFFNGTIPSRKHWGDWCIVSSVLLVESRALTCLTWK